MSNTNSTTYRNKDSDGQIYTQGCMMHVGNERTPTELFIKLSDLNDDLNAKDVERWVEIGNSTLFPAKLDLYFVDEYSGRHTNPITRKYLGLQVEVDPTRRLKQNDAIEVVSGILVGIPSSVDSIRRKTGLTKIRITKDRSGIDNPTGKTAWNGRLADHRLIDTKENLEDYVLRTIDTDEPKMPIVDEKPNNYRITIDYGSGSFIGYAHRLAALTFYRYLWSYHFGGLVKRVLHLVDLGVDPWDALFAVLSAKDGKYGSYYSLIKNPCILSIKQVEDNLFESNSVNNAFSPIVHNSFIWTNDDEKLLLNFDMFIAQKPKFVSSNRIRLKCIKPSSTLTADKIYPQKTEYETFVYVVGDDFSTRKYSKSRFIKVED